MCKKCTKCEVEKPTEEFYEYTHANGRKYRKSVCKECFANQSKQYQKKYYSKGEVKQRLNAVRREKLAASEDARLNKADIARRSYLNNLESNMLQRAFRRARLKDLDFNITLTDVLIPERCPILDIPIFVGTKGDYKNGPSLDRIDITKGYVKGNVRVISMLANTMKNDAELDLLETFAKNILKYIGRDDIVRTIGKEEPIEPQDKELVG